LVIGRGKPSPGGRIKGGNMKQTFEVWVDADGSAVFCVPNEVDSKYLHGKVDYQTLLGTVELDIVTPKKKVKRWSWVAMSESHMFIPSGIFIDQDDYEKRGCTGKLIQKIDSTEIECEE
jgi:hypothetical protein